MSGSAQKAAWFAVDWGTSRLRVWGMGASGDALSSTSSDDGMGGLTLDAFEPALLALIAEHLPDDRVTPVICCGMVGARQGWAEAPYIPVPCAPPDAQNAIQVETVDPGLDVRILPGLSQSRPADVMRGEETQIAGFLASEPGFDGVICLPGTHSKWVHVSAGEIVSFQTFMTGELFGLLSQYSVLRYGLQGEGWDGDAFSAALDETLSHPQRIATALFSLRAEGLLRGLAPDTARARLSGLLVGLELAGSRPYWLGRNVVLLGDGGLVAHYATALGAQGVRARTVDAEMLTLAGLRAAYATLKERGT